MLAGLAGAGMVGGAIYVAGGPWWLAADGALIGTVGISLHRSRWS